MNAYGARSLVVKLQFVALATRVQSPSGAHKNINPAKWRSHRGVKKFRVLRNVMNIYRRIMAC